MTDQSPKSRPKTSSDINNVTSLQGSPDGAKPCVSSNGQKISRSGLAPRRASRFHVRAKRKENPTSDTLPHNGSTSSASAALCSSLANKLRTRLPAVGSMIYKFTWKEKVTPSGSSYSQLVASVHRTKEKGFSFALTVSTHLSPIGSASPLPPEVFRIPLTGWMSPTVTQISVRSEESFQKRAESRAKTGRTSMSPGNLAEQVTLYLGAWPTASARDGKGGYLGGRVRDGKICTDVLDVTAQLSSWVTPLANDAKGSKYSKSGNSVCLKLPGQVELSFPIRLLTNGQVLTGCSAKMESCGQLDPAHSLWLMGYPTAWLSCADSAMQSCPE